MVRPSGNVSDNLGFALHRTDRHVHDFGLNWQIRGERLTGSPNTTAAHNSPAAEGAHQASVSATVHDGWHISRAMNDRQNLNRSFSAW